MKTTQRCLILLAFTAMLSALCACSTPRGIHQHFSDAPWWFQNATLSSRVTYVAPAIAEGEAEPELQNGSEAFPVRGLVRAIAESQKGDLLLLKEGLYDLAPTIYLEKGVGNSEAADFAADIAVTCGLAISGKAISIVGLDRAKTIIKTNAAYGIHFENAGFSMLRNLTVTGGVRGKDPRSTDAAVIARNTWLKVVECSILDNNRREEGAPEHPGIIGVCAREGAELTVRRCLIKGNSWDGVALYRSDPARPESRAYALIEDCDISEGQGVGVGVTWDASAIIMRTKIHDYWKGVGAFGESDVKVYNSSVYDQTGWGVIAAGNASLEVANSVIHHNGTTGLAAWSETSKGRFINNVISENGHAEKEWVGKKCGLWLNSAAFEVKNNCFWKNASFNVCKRGVPGGEASSEISVDLEAGNLIADPLFTNPLVADFKPKAGSPLVGAGSLEAPLGKPSEACDIGPSTPLKLDALGRFALKSRYIQ